MKTLILDIETAPAMAYVWRFFKENIGANQVRSYGYMLSYAAKWLGEKEIFYDDTQHKSEEEMIDGLYPLLDETDFVVAHNGLKFDLPKIRGRALVNGMKPNSPIRVIDTVQIARKEFGFESNSLANLAVLLGCEEKSDHKKFPGFKLWLEVLRDNPEAWAEIQEYNIQDIETLEEIYLLMRPWARNHPNTVVALESEEILCPACGGSDNHKRGSYYTNVGKYQRYQCQADGCGKWHRGRYIQNSVESRKSLTTNAI